MVSLKLIKTFLLRVWKDPVWSKVIAAGIIFLIGIIAAKVTNHSWAEIFSTTLNVLSFKIPIYFFLAIIALYFIVTVIINIIRKKEDPFWDEQMGNYTFKELHNILIVTKWPVQTRGMAMGKRNAPDDDLMYLFTLYYPILTKGIGFYDNIGDGSYLYGSLAPKLVGFGLVEGYDKPDENLPGKTNVAYRMTALGHRFHAKLDKLHLKEKMKEHRERQRKQL